jgi:SAM-dependent methyltransferase
VHNIDAKTVADFGAEWRAFDQSSVPQAELDQMFASYFAVFPWPELRADAVGADLGCGSGRWAQRVAGRVGHLHCVDASADALGVAARNLRARGNVSFHLGSVGEPPLAADSLDFAYCLGVLHHVPDPGAALRACAGLLKPRAPLLVYMYHDLGDRPRWYRGLWRLADVGRRSVSRLPHPVKRVVADAVAIIVYWPLARLAAAVEGVGASVEVMPLTFYRDKSFYTMRTDALDRFGTRLEQRFSRDELEGMMQAAGLEGITFSSEPPFWCAVGRRRSPGSRPGP